jgi:hypothetical protein
MAAQPAQHRLQVLVEDEPSQISDEKHTMGSLGRPARGRPSLARLSSSVPAFRIAMVDLVQFEQEPF